MNAKKKKRPETPPSNKHTRRKSKDQRVQFTRRKWGNKMGKSLLQNGGMSQGPGPGAALGARGAPAPPSGSLLAAARPSAARAAALAARPAGRGRGREARGVGPTLTFSQPVLEVGVTPSLAVEVNAVPDEEGPAHTGGDGTVPAHHLLSTVERGPKPTGRGSERRATHPESGRHRSE